MLFITEHKGKRIVFTDEGIKIGNVLLHAGEIKKLAHMGGDEPAFVFTYKGKRLRLPYKVEELKQIVPFYKKYLETDLVPEDKKAKEEAFGEVQNPADDTAKSPAPESQADGNVNYGDEEEGRSIRVPVIIPIIAAAVIALLIIAGTFVYKAVTTEYYQWPDNAIAEKLPPVSHELIYCSTDDEGYLDADLKSSIEDCKTYVEKCEAAGYNLDEKKEKAGGDFGYTASNASGDRITVYYYSEEKTMNICLYSSEWMAENEGADEEMEIED